MSACSGKTREMAAAGLDRASLGAWRDFIRDLEAKQAAEHTMWAYTWALVQFRASAGVPLAQATRQHVGGYLAGLTTRDGKPASRNTIDTRYRALRRFYRWAEAEEDVLAGPNPVTRVPAPQLDDRLVPVVTPDDAARLLRTCAAPASASDEARFEAKRDLAIIWLLMAPGSPRASELCGLDCCDLDMTRDVALIRCGKWARDRVVPFGPLAGRALSKYIRTRDTRPDATNPALFLGRKGRLTRSGLAQMIERRCAQAGIPKIHPHQLRHTAAIACKRDRMDPGVAKKLFGWVDDTMWERYGSAALGQLAVEQGHDAAARMEIAI